MTPNELVGVQHTYTLYTDTNFKVFYPTYTQNPDCGKSVQMTLYMNGEESNQAWLGNNSIEGFFDVQATERE